VILTYTFSEGHNTLIIVITDFIKSSFVFNNSTTIKVEITFFHGQAAAESLFATHTTFIKSSFVFNNSTTIKVELTFFHGQAAAESLFATHTKSRPS
jgi:hypothetical protein